LETAGPAVAQVHAALSGMTEKPGEVVGRVRLTVPRSAFHFVIEPVLPKFRERHPRIVVELVFEDRRVDIAREGFDAGIRSSEFVERDMVSVRLTEAFRFVVVGAPAYLDKHGTPERPAEQGLGLAYVMEPLVERQLAKGLLRRVLEPYAAAVPGFFLYYPSPCRAHVGP
jgi:DNA-binding transcriptional LysR family regulator